MTRQIILLDMSELTKFYLNCVLTFYKSPFQNSGETKKTLYQLYNQQDSLEGIVFFFFTSLSWQTNTTSVLYAEDDPQCLYFSAS